MNKGRKPVVNIKKRKEAGQFLKAMRKHVGLTQVNLAKKLKLNYYTMISQFEMGLMRVPQDLFPIYAKALQADKDLFLQKMIELYEPNLHDQLYADKPPVKLMDFIN